MAGDEDEQLLGAVASALLTLEELRDLTAFRMPYPAPVQGVLDRLALHCLRRGAHPSSSVPGLVRWGYERPLGAWPLVLPAAGYSPDDLLLDEDSGAPTALCHEIALCAEVPNPFLEVSRRMAAMAAFASERNRASTYRAMRDLLTTYQVLGNDRYNEVRFGARIGPLDDFLGEFFVPIGPGYDVGGEIHACAGCGGPLLATGENAWWCERDECRAAGVVVPGERWDHEDQVKVQGDRRHRQFVAGPGRVVRHFATALEQSGAAVECWPLTGPGELRVTVPEGRARTVKIVDWHNPALLGRAIAASVGGSGTDAVCWVVARYRTGADPAYLRVAEEHANSPMLFSEDGFLDLIRHEVTGDA
ncbi:hypothetical protein SAMN05421837_113208 [Amycolatopsis pretoriensis]|uniref:REase associating with pPIWI RE domain-containing protein n=1 Tax=Amycolatopsis pretoriensis TaxID=218821 RepID=A0A1H5RI43_9PSEU|nr:HU-CCDC81 and SPOR domain-containing protein [Amycolatopsis pretoriensis]SEF37378.1 hypothetical protein SAMN05421837_113208 [Amycolatopsis pretoriensis]